MATTKTSSKSNIEAAASSRSLNKTMKEIDRLLKGKRISATGKLRQDLHDKLYELLSKTAKSWYKRGFHRGHEESHAHAPKVPAEISKKMKIRASYLKKGGESVKLKSKLKT